MYPGSSHTLFSSLLEDKSENGGTTSFCGQAVRERFSLQHVPGAVAKIAVWHGSSSNAGAQRASMVCTNTMQRLGCGQGEMRSLSPKSPRLLQILWPRGLKSDLRQSWTSSSRIDRARIGKFAIDFKGLHPIRRHGPDTPIELYPAGGYSEVCREIRGTLERLMFRLATCSIPGITAMAIVPHPD